MLPLSKNPNLSVYLVQANHQCSKGIATKKQRKQQTISAQLLERVVSELSSKLNLVMALSPQWKGWTRFQDKPKKSSVGKWNSWLGCIIVISWPSRASVLKRKKGNAVSFTSLWVLHVICSDRGHLTFELFRFLVYEYMANGSLKDHLHCTISFISDVVYVQSILNCSFVFWTYDLNL